MQIYKILLFQNKSKLFKQQLSIYKPLISNQKYIKTFQRVQNKDVENEIDKSSVKQQTQIEQLQSKINEEQSKNELKYIEKGAAAMLVDQMPKLVQPYLRLMRLDKPIGTLVVLYPGIWSILGIASYLGQSTPNLTMLGIFTLGAFTMRSAGCIINDIWDYKYDRSVERTKTRPIASGEISIPSAIGLLGLNLSASLYLLLQLNLTTQILGACALFPVIIYPSAKRFTNWPQLFLGFAINWGALMGWSAILCENISNTQNIFSFLPAFALYTACINWTLFYDTIYANQDKLHDAKLGLKSTAISLAKFQKLWLLGFSTACTSNLCLYGYLTNQEPIFYAFMTLTAVHFLKQILFVNLNSVESCNKQFKSNSTIGLLVALGLLTSILIKN